MRHLMFVLIVLASCGRSPSIESSKPYERIWAMERLVGSDRPEEAVGRIAPLLDHDPDETVRAFAARCLAQLGTSDAIARVAAKIGSSDALHVRFAAAAALEEFPDPLAVPVLISYLRDPRRDSDIALGKSSGALVALGTRALEPLLAIANDRRESARARTSALAVVARIHDRSIRPKVVLLLGDPDRRVAAAAHECVAELDRPRDGQER